MSGASDSEESNELPPMIQQQLERAATIQALGRDFTSYTHDANFCIYFKIVHNRREAEEDIKGETFHPDFVHQFFVSGERIFGYKRPIIRLFYTASRLKRYVNVDYQDKLTKEKDGIDADDIYDSLRPVLEEMEHTRDLNQFINDVESQEEKEFRPPGTLLHEFESKYRKPKLLSRAQVEQLQQAGLDIEKSGHNGVKLSQNGHASTSNGQSSRSNEAGSSTSQTNSPLCNKKYQIYHANKDTPGFSRFQARMQSLIMWFIESATMIDSEDPRWDFFMIYEKHNPSAGDDDSQSTPLSTEDRYLFAGYATVYRYYAYPDKTRPRVSQMLLLPPYRRNTLGTALLQSIYDYFKQQISTLDITAEDPDEEFIAMRDFLDCKNCMHLSSYKKENLLKGWSEDMAKEAQQKLKLCQRQARKVYEILKFNSIDHDNEEQMTAYRLEIKNRLNIPHRRSMLDCDKMDKLGLELPEEMRMLRDNQRMQLASLDENFKELVKQYQHTVDKLKNAC